MNEPYWKLLLQSASKHIILYAFRLRKSFRYWKKCHQNTHVRVASQCGKEAGNVVYDYLRYSVMNRLEYNVFAHVKFNLPPSCQEIWREGGRALGQPWMGSGVAGVKMEVAVMIRVAAVALVRIG
jgi:hypothetical protein